MTHEKVEVNAGHRARNEGRAIRNWYNRFGPDVKKIDTTPEIHIIDGQTVVGQSPIAKVCTPEPDNSWIARISPTVIPY